MKSHARVDNKCQKIMSGIYSLFSKKTIEKRHVLPLSLNDCDTPRINPHHEEEYALELLNRLVDKWKNTSMVKKVESDLPDFEDKQPDFREDLLPFEKHPLYKGLSDEAKQKILSCGWMIYNKKTIAIETDIVTPFCTHIVKDEIEELSQSKMVASQTMTDESYHTQLVTQAIEITEKHRGFTIKVPTFNLVSEMTKLQSQQDSEWKKRLVLAATAIVSELFISNYLLLLSDDMNIQPINRLTVDAHRKDELRHGAIFKELAKVLYFNLNEEKQLFFSEVLTMPIKWFADLELDVWASALRQINIPHADQIIKDSRILNNDAMKKIDYREITKLRHDIGIKGVSTPSPQQELAGRKLCHSM